MSTKPLRLRLERKRGFRLQDVSLDLNGLPAKCVTRRTRFGNPFKIGPEMSREQSLQRFRAEALPGMDVSELRGHNLACACRLDENCHADILLEAANRL